jgi:hypothetical protein
MKGASHWTLGLTWMLLASGAVAQVPNDVPANHWCRSAVVEMVRLGVLQAPNGRFSGAQPVTRAELAQDLERLARALDAGKRVRSAAPAVGAPAKAVDWASKPVTRYELAATLWHAATMAAPALKSGSAKRFGTSEALPPAPKLALKPTTPGYASVKYLASRRMILQGSPLLAPPADAPVNGKDVAGAVSEVLIGLVDQFTDEPQNRVQLPEGGRTR